jgi:hypothetical protein
MNSGSDIRAFFTQVAANWSSYAVALAVIGSVTMALLQTIKDLFPIRNTFQRRALVRWLIAVSVETTKFNQKICETEAEKDLVSLAANGERRAFYDQQIEDLCALFNACMQVVLEDPEKHTDLLLFTAWRSEPADIALLLKPRPNPMTQEYLDSRNRVLHQCQRSIQGFQVYCAFRWKWLMQLAALGLGALLAFLALSFGAAAVHRNVLSVIVTALLSGFLAPVAKDILAIVQRARGE